MEKITIVTFKVESEGYQAIAELKKAPVTDNYIVSQAALVKKEGGLVKQLERFDTGMETLNDTAAGGIVGGLIGVLGGPLGMLLGGSMGALIGSSIDIGDTAYNESIIEKVTEMIADGEVALIALDQEEEEGALANAFAAYDTAVVEEDAAEVAEEIAHAVEVQIGMEREARQRLREEKKEEYASKIEDRRTKIKEYFEELKEKIKSKFA